MQLPNDKGNLKKRLYSCLCASFVGCYNVLMEKMDENGSFITIAHFSRFQVGSLLAPFRCSKVWPGRLLQGTVTCVFISVTKWRNVGYLSDVLWDFWDGDYTSDHRSYFQLTGDIPCLTLTKYGYTLSGFTRTWWRHQWKHFPRYCPFVRGIHRSLVISPHKGQWCGYLMFSLICA